MHSFCCTVSAVPAGSQRQTQNPAAESTKGALSCTIECPCHCVVHVVDLRPLITSLVPAPGTVQQYVPVCESYLYPSRHQHHTAALVQQPPHAVACDGPDAPPPVQLPYQRHFEALEGHSTISVQQHALRLFSWCCSSIAAATKWPQQGVTPQCTCAHAQLLCL